MYKNMNPSFNCLVVRVITILIAKQGIAQSTYYWNFSGLPKFFFYIMDSFFWQESTRPNCISYALPYHKKPINFLLEVTHIIHSIVGGSMGGISSKTELYETDLRSTVNVVLSLVLCSAYGSRFTPHYCHHHGTYNR